MRGFLPDELALFAWLNVSQTYPKSQDHIAERLVKRGLFTSEMIHCPCCGRHDTRVIRLTERGKFAQKIIDVLKRMP
jgi:hypothetical protein